MTPDAWIVLAVLLGTLFALLRELAEPDLVLFFSLAALLLTGVLTPQEAFAGFANSNLMTVAILFVVACAAQSSGGLSLVSRRLMGRGRGLGKSIFRMCLPVAGLSAFLNNTPIVAMFAPGIREWALKNNFSPSKFLIPLSYASIFGGVCTLIGTSTNLVVNGLYSRQFGSSLGMFELAAIGVPCALAGIAYLCLLGPRLLPDHEDLARSFSEAGREYLVEMQVGQQSPLAGKTVKEAGLRNLERLFLAEIVREGAGLVQVGPEVRMLEGDRLVFTGMLEGVLELQKIKGLLPVHDQKLYGELKKKDESGLIEAVVSPSSPMLRKTIKEGNFRARYDAVVLAVHRHGERVKTKIGEIVLKPGDTLLLLAGPDFHKRWSQSREFYLLSEMAPVFIPNRRKMVISLISLIAMVLLSATGVLPILTAAVLAATILLVARCVTAVEARRSLEINVLIVIGCAFGLSRALEKSGLAASLAEFLIGMGGQLGPLGLLAVIYLVTTVFTELITNNAAAAIVYPVAAATALQAGLDPKPFVIAIAVAASASFATPIGYQTNLMVYGPGGYRFRDFLRIGVPLNLLFLAVSLVLIPLVWSF